jgi:hypothetical protein
LNNVIALTVGTLSPSTETGKFVAIFLVPLAVGTVLYWLVRSIIQSIQERALDRRRLQPLSQIELDSVLSSGNNFVTRAEFLEVVLLAMNKVDDDFLQELRQHFGGLDVHGTGTLQREALVRVFAQHRQTTLSS